MMMMIIIIIIIIMISIIIVIIISYCYYHYPSQIAHRCEARMRQPSQTGLCFRKGKRAGGSLGKFVSCSPVLLRNVIG